MASEATTASKQPQRSILTTDLKSVTLITYISMCILLICFGLILRPFWWPQRPLQPPNSLKAQILPQIWHLWPKLHIQPCLFGLYRPSLDKSKKKIKKEQTDNYYSCVALRATTKKLQLRHNSIMHSKHNAMENSKISNHYPPCGPGLAHLAITFKSCTWKYFLPSLPPVVEITIEGMPIVDPKRLLLLTNSTLLCVSYTHVH